jgi:hypothetical protein
MRRIGINPAKSASVYKSGPPGRETGFAEICLPTFLAGYQVSEMATFRPSGSLSVVGECIGDFSLVENRCLFRPACSAIPNRRYLHEEPGSAVNILVL